MCASGPGLGWVGLQASRIVAGTTPVCEDIGRSLLTYGRRIPLTEWESRIAVTWAPGRGSGF